MKKPELHLHLLIDKLTKSTFSFALYRLPWTDEPVLVFQKDGHAEIFDSLEGLNNKKGFLFAPFQSCSEHPILLIKPDLHIKGWGDIMQALSGLFPKGISDEAIEAIPAPLDEQEHNELSTEESRKECYTQAFHRFIKPLQDKEFEKLVLSRSATYPIAEDFSPVTAFVTACNNYPRMMISLCYTPTSGIWIGSTPEIIISGQQNDWRTVALAGTMPFMEQKSEWSQKNLKEQQIVSEYIQKVLKSRASKISVNGPYTARAGNLIHLKTDILFTLKDTKHLGKLLEALHPTPAVCGFPKDSAYNFILEHEGYDRSYYSGIIGWMDPHDSTHLYVNLRCMHIAGQTTTLYAGGGILPSSTIDAEWEETQIKMNTMRECLC